MSSLSQFPTKTYIGRDNEDIGRGETHTTAKQRDSQSAHRPNLRGVSFRFKTNYPRLKDEDSTSLSSGSGKRIKKCPLVPTLQSQKEPICSRISQTAASSILIPEVCPFEKRAHSHKFGYSCKTRLFLEIQKVS